MEPLVCGHLQLIRELTEQVSSLGSELQAANLTVDRLRGEADTTGRGSSAGSSACSRAWLSAGGGACTEEGRSESGVEGDVIITYNICHRYQIQLIVLIVV